ncbi:uncharacterized, partial [Tachysurus ichikawai]
MGFRGLAVTVGVRFEPTDHTEYKSPSFLCVFVERRSSSEPALPSLLRVPRTKARL